MSASREKRARQNAQPVQKPVETTPANSTKKNVLIGIAVALVVILVIGSIVLFKGPYLRNNTVAATVGEYELTPNMLHYYYVDEFTQMSNDYGELFNYMFEDLTDVQDEVYDPASGQTWGDYMMDCALDQAAIDYTIYDAAVKAGYQLNEDGIAQLDENNMYVEMYASMYGLDPDAYIRTIYGNAASMESYTEYQTVRITAYQFGNEMHDSYTYTEDEIRAADEAEPARFNHYTYHSYLLTPTAASTVDGTLNTAADATDEEKAAAMDAAKSLAEEMAAQAEGDLDVFLTYASLYSGSESYRNGSVSIRSGYTADDVAAEAKEWITDPARAEGDTTAVETSSGYYVLYFVESSDNNYEAKDIRMITVSAVTTDADGNQTTDWERARSIVDTMEQTVADSTSSLEETFMGLAAGYSDDSATVSTGGLYENVYHGQLNEFVDKWLFEEAPAVEEPICIQGLDAFYYVYLVGDSGNYRDHLIDEALRNAEYSAWYEGTVTGATAVRNPSGMKYVDRTASFSATESTGMNGLFGY